MKTEYIQTIMALALVALMMAFMVMQPANKTLYVTYPLKAPLRPNTGQKIIEHVLRHGFKIEKNKNTDNCIIITREITNSICLSTMAIRIETTFKADEIESHGNEFKPRNGASEERYKNMELVSRTLADVFVAQGVAHHKAEYSW